MNYIEENNKIPCLCEVDVLVCGGGPAGIGAAIRAAREGVSVMIIEMQDCLGGIATAGMMSHWGGRSSSKVMQEIFELTYNKAQDVGWCQDSGCGSDAIYHEVQKVVLEEMMLQENIKILYYTKVCKAIVENNTIVGVIIENKSGRSVITQRVTETLPLLRVYHTLKVEKLTRECNLVLLCLRLVGLITVVHYSHRHLKPLLILKRAKFNRLQRSIYPFQQVTCFYTEILLLILLFAI